MVTLPPLSHLNLATTLWDPILLVLEGLSHGVGPWGSEDTHVSVLASSPSSSCCSLLTAHIPSAAFSWHRADGEPAIAPQYHTCVALDRILNFCGPQFLICRMGLFKLYRIIVGLVKMLTLKHWAETVCFQLLWGFFFHTALYKQYFYIYVSHIYTGSQRTQRRS